MAVRIFDNQYINGAWIPSSNSGKYFEVTDSNTAAVVAKVPDGSVADMESAIQAARAAFFPWMNTPLAQRKALLAKVLANWQKKKPESIEWFQKEVGCTAAFAKRVQSNMVDWHLGTALKLVDDIQFEEKTSMGSLIVREPIGVVGCITPWNYPLNQIAAKIFPAMLVGCTVVLKPSEVTPVNAYLLAEAIHEAGLPKGVFNMVLGPGPVVGEHLSGHPDVDMISFTGSTVAGKAITQTAAGTLKVVRTELGGKSASLMLEDADLKKLIPVFMGQLISNSGQSCNALSRMLVPKSRYEEAVQIAKSVADQTVVGRSGDPKSTIGPLVSQVQWDRVQAYLKKGIEEGARLVTGGPGKPAGLEDGYYVKPTVFADVNNKMTIAQEEIFGPVLCLIPYNTEQEGIEIVNDTIYGLNNAVGSSNPEHAYQVAKQLRSGTVMINGTHGSLDAPFGGYKQSGNAREWGKTGLEEYLVIKHMAGKPPSELGTPPSKL